MGIIAAHQQGLIQQLEVEASALAGRPSDHGQRAVVLHHLFDHSRGSCGWALAEARRAMRIAKGIAALRRRLGRWGWTIARRNAAAAALAQLAEALGAAGRSRTVAIYFAYRLSCTAALRSEAEQRLPRDLLAGLDQCHAARRAGVPLPTDVALRLAGDCEDHASSAVDRESLAAAWAAIEATGLGRAARRLLGDASLARAARRDARRGSIPTERDLLRDPALPAAFRANPAQHYYAMCRTLSERRRQEWRDACDREPDSFELAA